MHFTLRFMVYNNGLVGGNVCRLENFKFTCAHVQFFFFLTLAFSNFILVHRR